MRRLAILLLVFILPATASAWAPASEEKIARKGAALAPPDLRMLIDKFEADYRKGLERAQAEDSGDAHRFIVRSGRGRLRERIEKETRATVEMIRKGQPMSQVVERLGRLSHLISDANNPFHVADDDPRLNAMRGDFESFAEKKLPKFPTVYYGLQKNFRLDQFLDRTFARSARFYPLVREEYFRNGSRRTSAEFDDRSTAFGVASISYSRSVSDLVNLYYYIWKEAGGDVRTAAVMRDGNLLLNGSN